MTNLKKTYDDKAQGYSGYLNPYVIRHIENNKKILDVGCGDGTLGKYFIDHNNAKVSGVDISPEAIKIAKQRLNFATVCNIENDALPFKQKQFDIIVCADVIEHLYNPLAALKKLKQYLKDDGYMVLSVPNIANISIRWNLLFGRFDYTDTGILDNSHIRFFTQKSLLSLITDAGLVVSNYDYSPGFSFIIFLARLVRKYNSLLLIQERLNMIMPTLTCKQFIISTKKNR
jgi:2-polyprenyl-3-methyl-5-hydroxy-6-metoxy-1,4-benzoquinol methylase